MLILRELQQDGAMSLTVIANKLKVSMGTVGNGLRLTEEIRAYKLLDGSILIKLAFTPMRVFLFQLNPRKTFNALLKIIQPY